METFLLWLICMTIGGLQLRNVFHPAPSPAEVSEPLPARASHEIKGLAR